jgi:hypothetical protein
MGRRLKISGSAQDPKELAEEMRILNTLRAREMVRSEDSMNLDTFTSDAIDGRAVNMVHGSLGLISAQEAAKKGTKKFDDVLSKLMGEDNMFVHSEIQAVAPIPS